MILTRGRRGKLVNPNVVPPITKKPPSDRKITIGFQPLENQLVNVVQTKALRNGTLMIVNQP